MSGLALIAQRARRRGDRLRPRRDAVLRASCARPGSSRRSATTPSHAAPGTELVVSTAIPADLPEVAGGASAVLHRVASCSQQAARAAARDRGRRHARQDDDDRDGRARAAPSAGSSRGYAVGAELPRPAAAPAERAVGQRGVDGRRGRRVRPLVPAASSPRSPSSRTSSSTTTRPTRPRSRCGAAFAIVPRARPGRTAPSSRGRAPASTPPPGARVMRFGLGPAADLRRARRRAHAGAGMRFDARRATAQAVATVELPVPGEHNVLNALAALGAARRRRLRLERRRRARWRASGPPARRFEPQGEARRGARVRRLRPPRDRGRGDAARGARRSSPGGWSPCSSRICTRARSTRTASSAARSRSPTWSWCSTSTRARERPEGELAGVERQAGRRRGRRQRRRAARSGGCRPARRPSRVLSGHRASRRPRRDARRRRRRRRRPRTSSTRLRGAAMTPAPARAPRARLPARAAHDDPHRWPRGLVRASAQRRRARGSAAVGGRGGARRRSRGLGIEPPRSGRRVSQDLS